MNVLVLYGSSRRHGNTEILTDRVVQNVDCTKIYLSDKKIHPIDDKRHDAEGFGFVDDDYDDIIQQVLNHDTLVFSTPVYWYGMSGQMKNFIDRWSQSLRDKRFNFKASMAEKTAYVVMVGGDEPRIKGLPLVQQFKHIFDFVHMSFGGYVLGQGNAPGDILNDARALADALLLNQSLRS